VLDFGLLDGESGFSLLEALSRYLSVGLVTYSLGNLKVVTAKALLKQ
jgi:hypothetical protein